MESFRGVPNTAKSAAALASFTPQPPGIGERYPVVKATKKRGRFYFWGIVFSNLEK
jgi:hypothetical protein